MKIGVFGGTFDPVHVGHLIVAEAVADFLSLGKVLFVPVGDPWMKRGRDISSREHRRRMVELAIAGNPRFELLPAEVDRPGPTYTVDTLEELRQQLGLEAELHFMAGADALSGFEQWKSPDRITQLAKVVGIPRPGTQQRAGGGRGSGERTRGGYQVLWVDVPQVSISGVELRSSVGQGLSIRYLVPDAVLEYIREQGLYRETGVEKGG